MSKSQPLHSVVFRDTRLATLSESHVLAAAERGVWISSRVVDAVTPIGLAIDAGTFSCLLADGSETTVCVEQESGQLHVSSGRPGPEGRLTWAEATVLIALLRRQELGVFFLPAVRYQKLQQAAAAYGLECEPNLDRYLVPTFIDGQLTIQSRLRGLLPLTSPKLGLLVEQTERIGRWPGGLEPLHRDIVLVLSRHRHYRHTVVEVIEAERTKSGDIKSPFKRIEPLKLLSESEEAEQWKLFGAIAQLQQIGTGDRMASDLSALRTVVENNSAYPLYYHDEDLSANFSSKSLVPMTVELLQESICLSVRTEGIFYAITGRLTWGQTTYAIHELPLKLGCFILLKNRFLLVDTALHLLLIKLLHEQGGKLLIHAGKYCEFQEQLLDRVSDSIRVEYSDLPYGNAEQLTEGGFTAQPERLIYLSDFGPHVMIIPVVRYGDTEVAIRTEKQLKGTDARGNEFLIPRNDLFEEAFIALLIKQHPHLAEQLDNSLYYFFLHRTCFLDEQWFLPVFDEWCQLGIQVFGFKELNGNKLNPHKVAISIQIISGIDWFNANHEVRFGKQKASLKKIQAALRNKRNYVVLDDGTQGILPREWLEKFATYFEAGEVVDDHIIRYARNNFETVSELYDTALLDEESSKEITRLREGLSRIGEVPPMDPPPSLRTRLRPYQRQGLGWLCFLDSLRMGGILADEMGLGKTVQVIAFMLQQRESGKRGTDLVVLPATLIFNWQQELATLAPTLRVLTLYGSDRPKSTAAINGFDVVLTSYATLLNDIRFLKEVAFNYIYLDESQNIKNPDSQRYKAARLLQAHNRIAISGTPFENSSFDLYGQLSFVCPGLLGDKRYFRDVYGKPIDQFKDKKRRKELQRKIQPFILRRTKAEVAAELPEKVTGVLYCEMDEQQRGIYNAYEKEFRDFICALSGDELDKRSMHVLRGLTRLRQICNSPALLPDGMLNRAVSAKLDVLKEQVRDKSPYHKIVIFSQFVSMLNLIGVMLEDLDVPYISLTGSTRFRQGVVDSFQEDPRVRVFLVSLKAGGTGLNLTAAELVYLVDPWWNPATENQAIDRVHRIGQRNKVTAYRLVTPGTVEEKVMQLQDTKRELGRALIAGREQLLGLLQEKF